MYKGEIVCLFVEIDWENLLFEKGALSKISIIDFSPVLERLCHRPKETNLHYFVFMLSELLLSRIHTFKLEGNWRKINGPLTRATAPIYFVVVYLGYFVNWRGFFARATSGRQYWNVRGPFCFPECRPTHGISEFETKLHVLRRKDVF